MRVLRFFAAVGFGLFAVTACESDPDDLPLQISEDCDACLSREDCRPEWEACTADAGCETYVVCALQSACYTRAPGSGCEERAGCSLPDGTDEEASGELSAEFEGCARTACAARCGFVEP